MHGEYKVSGGKLVAVDVDVVDGLLSGTSVSGDFFLEPDEALDVVRTALDGLPADAPTTRLADAVDDALAAAHAAGVLPEPAVLVGFDARAVAVAVRRALGLSTAWTDHTVELLHPGPMPPAMHAALDQVLTEELAAGRRGPTLRFWEWVEPAVIIGSFQSLRNEVDLEAVDRHGITVVRRISGGGAMFMEAGNCITFSLVVPVSLVDGMTFEESYAFLNQWVLGALADVGVRAELSGLNDISSPAGKIAGSAQKRVVGGAVLHHVTMSYDIDATKMLEVLRIGREKLSDKGTTSANKRVDPVRSQTHLAREAVIDAFVAHFRGRYATVDGDLRSDELERAHELVRTKFSDPAWTARVP
ncbi:lipoate--protein ligase family protein [Cellulomonas fimi]|uniref:Biotin/lipoate A/B protein ligase n=1 Tax=Cellulomonas fimi (strain ATCC 484 / DSM 20113 / JCM 1341 / CCUG 24087 / LMG 16345 / NBRC 15513 / NCIMB 8980 / NCTC 7547 / NRS-133) TaxID=590998 RepID=F4H6Q6_CELFA|nr:biotin/lipoate A/B protein ligase family protein [Cellulomonas fimi]AEE46817.1 biotin/lipoate A/B protein ligase [Cellulomonas fimi ATCC 484]NNH06360.1 lipoate--protein ligase family protein [Cellulomonas fimi]VEH34270.1 Probable lipoate-protein ligase A [Cellulomonas fimi]